MFWKGSLPFGRNFRNSPVFFEVRTIAMIEELMTDIFRSEPLIANDQQPSEVTARYKQLLDRIDHEFYSITFYDAAQCKQ